MSQIFNEEFQTKVLYLLATERITGLQDYIKSDYFFIDSLAWLYNAILQLRSTYFVRLSATQVATEARLQNKYVEWTDNSKKYFELFLSYLSAEKPPEDIQFVIDKVIQFIRKRELDATLSRNNELIINGDWENLQLVLQQNVPAVSDILKDENDLFNVTDFAFLTNRGRILTNFYPIDNVIGGLTRGELLLLMADTNVGKSLFMTWLSGQIVKQGGKVLYITLEMSKALTNDRFFISILDEDDQFRWQNYRSVADNPETATQFEVLRQKYSDLYKDRLRIFKGKNLGFSLADVNLLVKDRGYDVVALDYLDVMQPPIKITESALIRLGQSQLIQGLRDIGEANNLCIITATQANRQSEGKRVLRKSNASEDYGKIRIADNVIAIGENEEDMLSNDKIFAIIKARNSLKNVAYRYGVDYSRMRFFFKQEEIVRISDD